MSEIVNFPASPGISGLLEGLPKEYREFILARQALMRALNSWVATYPSPALVSDENITTINGIKIIEEFHKLIPGDPTPPDAA